jgi:hypothetical protein
MPDHDQQLGQVHIWERADRSIKEALLTSAGVVNNQRDSGSWEGSRFRMALVRQVDPEVFGQSIEEILQSCEGSARRTDHPYWAHLNLGLS